MDLTVRDDGSGTVAVTVSLDQAAQTQVGNLASQLQTSDLAQAGWVVSGPRPGAGGTEVVSATKAFPDPAEANADVASLAGAGPAAGRPFHLVVARRHTFWHTTTTVTGTIDLTCGVGCFGDAGLQRQLGSDVGVDPGALSAHSGVSASQALTFSIVVNLPGRVHATRPAAVRGDSATWNPVLGKRLPVDVSTRVVNRGTVISVVVAGIVVVAVVAVVAVLLVLRRRGRASATRRPPARHSRA